MSRRIEIRRNPDGSVDEVLLYDGDECLFHLEQMSDSEWWFRLYPDGGINDSEGFNLYGTKKRGVVIHRQEDF